jgi:hypothetical protein
LNYDQASHIYIQIYLHHDIPSAMYLCCGLC